MTATDLTDFEWRMLASLSLAAHAFGRWQSIEPSRQERAAIDYLVLSGLVERRRVDAEWACLLDNLLTF